MKMEVSLLKKRVFLKVLDYLNKLRI